MKRKAASSAKQATDEPVANRGVYGEGNYQATRAYNEATRQFVRSERSRRQPAKRRRATAAGSDARAS